MNIERTFLVGTEKLGLEMTPLQLEQCQVYLAELMRWNKKINLTGLRDTKEIIVKHFLDSMIPLSYLKLKAGLNCMDLGSGGGFPGLVLKIMCPELKMTLVEPTQKKVSFLHHVIGLLDLKNVFVCDTRINAVLLPLPEDAFDLLVSRALAPETVLSEGLSLAKEGGSFLFLQAKFDEAWWKKLIEKYPVLELQRPYVTTLPFLNDARTLISLRVQDTSS